MSKPVGHVIQCAVCNRLVAYLDRNARRVMVNDLFEPAANRLLDIFPDELRKRITGSNSRFGEQTDIRLFVRRKNHGNSRIRPLKN